MILVLDNYDSFVYNVARYLEEAGGEDVRVVRSDQVTVAEVLEREPSHLVVSPGPCTPSRAGISVDLVRALAGRVPTLGICLGHQALAEAFGGRIVRAPTPVHGRATAIHHSGRGILRDLPSPFAAGRYHSLVVDPDSLPEELEVTARDEEGVIMAVEHRSLPIWGVQFHPESILTRHGDRLIRAFLEEGERWASKPRSPVHGGRPSDPRSVGDHDSTEVRRGASTPPDRARAAGVRIPEAVPTDDRAFLLGDGLFETIRVYGGHPFRLEAHLARLAAGAERIGMLLPEDLPRQVARVVAEGPDEGALRITASRRPGGDLSGGEPGEARVALRLLPLRTESVSPELRAVLAGWLHEEALTATLKTTSYLERIVALRRARERGADEALVRNSRGLIVEGSFSNVIAVTPGGTLIVPGPPEGALPGITAGIVTEEARRLGFPVEERGLKPAELGGLSELILTSSIREVVAVVEVEGRGIGEGRSGPVFQRLRRAFQEVVAREASE
jgi:anthranilate synthase/aminodeoxychorismate synthase-like glutamine amidotransferase